MPTEIVTSPLPRHRTLGLLTDTALESIHPVPPLPVPGMVM